MKNTHPYRKEINKIYGQLLKEYGPQGWWPIDGKYHNNKKDCFQVCVGAILTQNTNWKNVEKALQKIVCKPQWILECKNLGEKIKPAGYYNQKARKLRVFSEYYIGLSGVVPKREELLELWGIGPETADSILLYGFERDSFVVDTYTKRILKRLGWGELEYETIRKIYMENMDAKHYNECHALFVEHCKRHCTKTPNCIKCPLEKICEKIYIQKRV